MTKGGVIMDVVNAEQAAIAEDAGAVSVMALERVPSDIRKAGGVARMADPSKVIEIMDAVEIPVMAKVRIGHFVEAQVLQSLGVDMIDESEVLTQADEDFHIDKEQFTIPFVCGARDLGEALRRVDEGAAMIRTKGEAGTGNVVEAVRHMRTIQGAIREIENKTEEREEDTEKFYVAEEGVPLYICDQNALIAYYGSEIELNRTIVSPRGDGIYSARLPLLDVALPFLVYGRGLLFLDAYYLLAETVNNNTWRPITSVMIDIHRGKYADLEHRYSRISVEEKGIELKNGHDGHSLRLQDVHGLKWIRL